MDRVIANIPAKAMISAKGMEMTFLWVSTFSSMFSSLQTCQAFVGLVLYLFSQCSVVIMVLEVVFLDIDPIVPLGFLGLNANLFKHEGQSDCGKYHED